MRKNLQSSLLGRIVKFGGESYLIVSVFLADSQETPRVLVERCDSFGRNIGGKPIAAKAIDVELQ